MYGGLVTSSAIGDPSMRNWTPATASLSTAIAASVAVPEIVAPSTGMVTLTVGGIVSHCLVAAVVVERADTLPASSNASTPSV